MKNIILFVIGIFFFQFTSAQDSTQVDWKSDLDFLKKELPQKHFKFFAIRSENDFSKGIDAIKAESKNLTNFQIALRTQQLIAKFGDSHTMLNPTPLFDQNQLLPLGFMWANDKLYVLHTAQEYKQLLGSQVTKINKIPVATIIDSISTLLTVDNRAVQKSQVPNFIPSVQVLEYFGFTKEKEVSVEFLTSANKLMNCRVKPMLITPNNKVSFQPDSLSFGLKNMKHLFTDSYFPQDKIYYILYNKCISKEVMLSYGNKEQAETLPSFEEFGQKILDVLKKEPVSKIIFDLRNNGGGSSAQGTALIEKIAAFLKENPKVKTYVVIGRNTFSSAILNAMDFKRLTNAMFVGEETAGKPNHFGEVRSFELPSSKLQVYYSTKYFKNVDQDVNTLTPDVYLETSFADFSKGIDPVYEWVKKQ